MIPDAAPPHPPGAVWLEYEQDGVVLHLEGEIDAATVAACAGSYPAPAEKERVVAVDASGVTFLNSLGISFLVRQIWELEASRA